MRRRKKKKKGSFWYLRRRLGRFTVSRFTQHWVLDTLSLPRLCGDRANLFFESHKSRIQFEWRRGKNITLVAGCGWRRSMLDGKRERERETETVQGYPDEFWWNNLEPTPRQESPSIIPSSQFILLLHSFFMQKPFSHQQAKPLSVLPSTRKQ